MDSSVNREVPRSPRSSSARRQSSYNGDVLFHALPPEARLRSAGGNTPRTLGIIGATSSNPGTPRNSHMPFLPAAPAPPRLPPRTDAPFSLPSVLSASAGGQDGPLDNTESPLAIKSPRSILANSSSNSTASGDTKPTRRHSSGHAGVVVITVPRKSLVLSAPPTRRLSIGEKAFGAHPKVSPREVTDADAADMELEIVSRPMSAAVACENKATTPRVTSLPPELIPLIPDRSHPPRKKSIVEESITRVKVPTAPPRPAFGRSEYGRGGLPNQEERDEARRIQKLNSYIRHASLLTIEEQEEHHFTDFEPVESGSVPDVIHRFEQHLEEVKEQREEEEAAKAAEALRAAQQQQQQQQQSTATSAVGSPLVSMSALNGVGGLLAVAKRLTERRATVTPEVAGFNGNNNNASSVPPSPPPASNREYHLLKLLFRRSLLYDNSFVEYLMTNLGETETMTRLQRLNDRYGCRRINREDFYYLMQELIDYNAVMGGGAAAQQPKPLSAMASVSGIFDSNTALDASQPNATTSPQHGEDVVSPLSNQESIQTARVEERVIADLKSSYSQSGSSSKKYNLRRGDTDLLFAACDWRMIGVVDDDEIVDSVRLLFRPMEHLIASHCKRVVEGRCSISHMLSIFEAETMLRAVASIGYHRYGDVIVNNVDTILNMLKEVMTSGYVPLICFRNFIVHGPMLSRALDEMTNNAELPEANIRVPSPDPDRDLATVRASLKIATDFLQKGKAFVAANKQASPQQPPLGKVPSLTPPPPLALDPSKLFAAAKELLSKESSVLKSPSSASPMSSGSQQAPQVRQGRDLTHPRFRADMNVVNNRRLDDVPEHDHPKWYSNTGVVWMRNDLHGPLVII